MFPHYRTTLFRELKLLKLLLRTLEDRFQSSASHRSSQIRGYSRQTESYVSSLSNSAGKVNIFRSRSGQGQVKVNRLMDATFENKSMQSRVYTFKCDIDTFVYNIVAKLVHL